MKLEEKNKDKVPNIWDELNIKTDSLSLAEKTIINPLIRDLENRNCERRIERIFKRQAR